MIISVRKFLRSVYMLLWIITASVVLYKTLTIVQTMMAPVDPYKEPSGKAVKVVSRSHHNVDWWQGIMSNLRDFYVFGE